MTVTLKDFYADWCGPCKTQDPILEDLSEEWTDVEFEKVNVDEQQDVANEYQVRSLPTLVVENKDGIVERFVGVTQAEDVEAALEKASASQNQSTEDTKIYSMRDNTDTQHAPTPDDDPSYCPTCGAKVNEYQNNAFCTVVGKNCESSVSATHEHSWVAGLRGFGKSVLWNYILQ